jgi:hypothetical protein
MNVKHSLMGGLLLLCGTSLSAEEIGCTDFHSLAIEKSGDGFNLQGDSWHISPLKGTDIYTRAC